MRLWHYKLIPYLPKQQLTGQWRECCAIAKNILEKGTPNHLLVNKVMNYSEDEFNLYSRQVWAEMCKRGYRCDWYKFSIYRKDCPYEYKGEPQLFVGWHNTRYLNQCLGNLEEKYDCGGLSLEEWTTLIKGYISIPKGD